MGKRVVAITSCITGIAHTYMAAKALENAAEELGYEISVEKQGASGAEDVLSAEDIAAADAVVFATDKAVDESRFVGKDVLIISCDAGIKDPKGAIEKAVSKTGPNLWRGAARHFSRGDNYGFFGRLGCVDHLQAHHERRLSHAAHRCSGRHPDCSELCVRQCPE